MILINQYKFKARMISPMHINKMINYATCSTFMLNMRLVICKPGFKTYSRSHPLQITNLTRGKINLTRESLIKCDLSCLL